MVADTSSVPHFDALVAEAGLTGRAVPRNDYGLPRSLVYTNYKNFAPRLGVAYQVSPKLVARAGFGIFYNGFEIRACYGSWQQEPLTATSRYMIYVCQRR